LHWKWWQKTKFPFIKEVYISYPHPHSPILTAKIDVLCPIFPKKPTSKLLYTIWLCYSNVAKYG
jgi:hypothetical protein